MLVILALFLASTVNAQVSMPPWDWSTYVGVSHWSVTDTEYDTGCGGGSFPSQYSINITHNMSSAVMGDIGHGPANGTFTGNTFHVASRTVPDGPGTSAISDYDLTFSSDCSSFSGTYTWTYTDPNPIYDCSGSDAISGTNSQGCPAPTVVPGVPPVSPPTTGSETSELYDAHTDVTNELQALNTMNSQQAQLDFEKRFPDEYSASDINDLQSVVNAEKTTYKNLDPKVETEYDTILQADPGNFWANWDMAQLKKAQGQYDQYYAYIHTAAQNTNQFEGTENTGLEQAVADSMGLEKFPTVQNSAVLREESNEVNPWNGGPINGQTLPSDISNDPPTEHLTLVTLFSSKIYSIVNTLGGPGSQ